MGSFLRLVLSLGKGEKVIEFGISLKRDEAGQVIKTLKGRPRVLMSRAMRGETLDRKEMAELQDAITEALLTLRARSSK